MSLTIQSSIRDEEAKEHLSFNVDKKALVDLSKASKEARKVTNYFKFFKDLPTFERRSSYLITGSGFVNGAGFGVMLGFCTGPGAPIACPILGVAFGAIGTGMASQMSKDLFKSQYADWCSEKTKPQQEKIRAMFYEQMPPGTQGLDPLELCPIIDPVRLPCGEVYERSSIMRIIKKTGICPTTRAPLKESDLKPAPEVLGKMNSICKGLLASEKGKDKDVQEGIRLLSEDLETNVKMQIEAVKKDLDKKLKNKEITLKQHTDVLGRFLDFIQPE